MIWPFKRKGTTDEMPMPAPDGGPIWAIGDIHGCADQLDGLLDKIAADGGGRDALVFLGDYADRGPDSARVFQRVRALSTQTDRAVTCLLGNHDRMLLDFLADPARAGARFLGNGGQETLFSYGVMPDRSGSVEERLMAQATAFAAAFADMADWLSARPLWHQSGTCLFVHAQTDPALPMTEQSEDVLLWERPPKHIRPRTDKAWVIHGHTVVPQPRIEGGHIAIDTGAFRGGPMTAVRLARGETPHFVQV